MKKPCLLWIFFLFLSFFAFGDTNEAEELDFLLFYPNSGNQFVNEAQAKTQLDDLAKFLGSRTLLPGQIVVYGYAADVANDIEPVSLSRDRALFVINELQKRGLPKELFADPIAYGSVNFWGANDNETDRIPNRRVRILLDGTLLSPVVIKDADMGTIIADNKNNEEVIQHESAKSGSKFPWYLILLLLAILAITAVIILLASGKRKRTAHTAQETAPAVIPVPPEAKPVITPDPPLIPAIPEETAARPEAAVPAVENIKVKILEEEEIRRYAYDIFERRNYQNGDDISDWYQSVSDLCAYYEAQGYRVTLYWELTNP